MTARGFKLVALSVVLGATALLLSGCSFETVFGLGWPTGITPEGQLNRDLWVWSVIASLVVGVIVWALIFWTSAFHRKKDTDTELPRQFGYNMPLELVLTVVPFIIISVLFYFTVKVQETMLDKPFDPAEVVVDVTAFQWNWKFGYDSVQYADGSFEYKQDGDAAKLREERIADMESKPEGVDAHGEERVGPINGLNPEDRTYLPFDEIETVGTSTEIPILVLPTGKSIEFRIASADVIHGFWVPEFLFKRDVLPNPEANNSDHIFQISEILETGPFVGRCTEMCGTYHSMMNFEVRVVEPGQFQQYIRFREDNQEATNAEALMAIGLPPTAQTTEPFDTRRGEQAPQASR